MRVTATVLGARCVHTFLRKLPETVKLERYFVGLATAAMAVRSCGGLALALGYLGLFFVGLYGLISSESEANYLLSLDMLCLLVLCLQHAPRGVGQDTAQKSPAVCARCASCKPCCKPCTLSASQAVNGEMPSGMERQKKYIRYVFHEIRVPFQSVMLGVENLLGEPGLSGYSDILHDVKQGLDYMNCVLNDVLILAKLDE
ncbi:unnamed protein product, partial [Chrysoparadoxa australica]